MWLVTGGGRVVSDFGTGWCAVAVTGISIVSVDVLLALLVGCCLGR